MIIIFPMTGSLFFEGNDFHFPKPLIEIDEKTIIEHAIDTFVDIPDIKNPQNSHQYKNNIDHLFEQRQQTFI